MTQTYWQIKQKIEALQAQAEEIKRSELADVIASTRATIQAYGLTAKDLFGTKAATAPAKGGAKGAAAKFADAKGNVWGGRGPRPRWVRDALASGLQLNDLLAGRATAAGPATADAPAAVAPAPKAQGKASAKARRKGAGAKPAAKQKVAAKYRDAAGNTWSGRGLQPRWLKAAIADGKKIEDFAI